MTTVALGLLAVSGLVVVAALVQGARAARSVRKEAPRSGAEPEPAPDRGR